MRDLLICLVIGLVLGIFGHQPLVGMFMGAVVWAITD